MNKRKVVLTSLLGFTLLFGCSQVEDESNTVSVSLPEGFDLISKDKIGERADQLVLKHNDTNCYYLMVEHWEAVSIEQMFIKKDGVSVPYCDK